jgi:hypothetical protein
MLTAVVTREGALQVTAQVQSALSVKAQGVAPLKLTIGFPEVRSIAGLSLGKSTLSGIPAYTLLADGATAGSSASTVQASYAISASGATSGTSVTAASASQAIPVTGQADGVSVSTAVPFVGIVEVVAGQADGASVSTATPFISTVEVVDGQSDGVSVSTATLDAFVLASGASAGASTTTGAAQGETAYSPEAQAVLDRMINTTTKQDDAIANFVDTLVASGDWGELYDVHCMSLGAVDYLTGWKVNAGMTPIGSPVHIENDGVQFSTTSYMDLGYHRMESKRWYDSYRFSSAYRKRWCAIFHYLIHGFGIWRRGLTFSIR